MFISPASHSGPAHHGLGPGGAAQRAVVKRINVHGKLLVQSLGASAASAEDAAPVRKVPLVSLQPAQQSGAEAPFRLDKFTRNEDSVRVATSIFSLVAQGRDVSSRGCKQIWASNGMKLSVCETSGSFQVKYYSRILLGRGRLY